MAIDQQDGIHAQNKDFEKFEGVNKTQEYNLVENKNLDQFDDEFEVKTCDMDDFFNGGDEGKRTFAQNLGTALEEIGFAVLSGHGVDTNLYEQAEAKVNELFTTTTLEQRLKFEARRHGSVNQGYFPIKKTTIIHPDLVEGWVFCRRAFELAGNDNFKAGDFWPASDADLA